MSIWQTLSQPFFVLAPMEDVTDSAFRQVIAYIGKPDLFFTEFTNVDGILSVATDKVSQRLQFTPSEKPLIAQIWGNKPESFFKVAKILAQKGFDGIDINMGCPDRGVTKKEAGGGLIKNPTLASEIIAATKEGAHSAISGQASLPVSVKTRIGFSSIVTETWLELLLRQDIAALTIHGRTVAQQSKVPANWDEIGKGATIRNSLGIATKIIGNGDVMSREQGLGLAARYNLDGIMVGRGIFANPWFFNPTVEISQVTIKQRYELLLRHMDLFVTTWGSKKNFDILKKFFKAYLRDFDGAAEFRAQLMQLKDPEEIRNTIQNFLQSK